MKFATAIIVASRRVSSAIACEIPANALLTRIAARMITSQPSDAGVDAHAERERDEQDDSAWIAAVNAERTICESTSENRDAGVARKRSTTLWSRSLIIDMPLQVAPKNAFMTTIAGARNVMYERGAEAAEPRHVPEELAVEHEPHHRLHEQQHDPDRLAHQVPRLAQPS